MGFFEGLVGLLILIADVWAIINVISSRSTTTAMKIVWVLLILLLPVVGLIIWLVAGPRKPQA
ncbi:MAG TPA: PLDc N-terminal domain-containing protein [Desulfobacterales bacterium]